MANEQQQRGFYTSDFRHENGMDFDSVIQSVAKNTATNALNVFTINVGGQGDNTMIPANGNALSFTLPTITTQNKVYQFSISEPTGQTFTVNFLNLNYSVIGTATVTTTGVIATDIATFISSITTALTGYTITLTHTVAGVFTLTITSLLGFDWLMVDTGTSLTNPVVTQEAIDRSITDWNNGKLLPIGGIDYLGDLFIISTCQGNLPQSFNIVGTGDAGGKVEVLISGDFHTLFLAGESVNVQGLLGTTEANGIWSVVSSSFAAGQTTIILFSTVYSTPWNNGGGTISLYNEGYLNISVHQKNLGSGIWTNTSLLSTKAINKRFYNPIRKEIVANKNNNILSIYYVDGSDYDRVFAYTGAYITNGAINFYNPLGQYTYDSVGVTSRNLRNVPTSIVQVSGYSDTGGAVPSGNWRYSVVPLDSNLTSGQISLLSNPVNVYNGNTSQPATIVGTPGVPSSMTVTVTVSEIPQNVWSYFDLIGVNYVGLTETAYLIKRVPIPANATTLNIVHTGLETATAYTAGFVFPSTSYISSGTQTTCANTLLKGDLTANEINDYSVFSQLWTHVLNRNTSALLPTGDDRTGFTLGEFQIPVATSKTTGYMLNETERHWLCYELIAGGFTPLFWCDDIRFDNYATNRANPFNGQATRRTANNIPDFNLSESPTDPATSTDVINSYVHYVTLSPPSGWQNYLIDGVPLSQLVKRVHVFRTDNTTVGLNEVIACGLNVLHVSHKAVLTSGYIAAYGGTQLATDLFDNPFLTNDIAQDASYLPLIGANVEPYTTLFGGTPSFIFGAWNSTWGTPGNAIVNAADVKNCSFYSPDLMFNQVPFTFNSANYYLFNYGQPDWAIGNGSGNMDSYYTNYIGSTSEQYWGAEIRLSGSTFVTADPYTHKLALNNAYNLGIYSGNTFDAASGNTYHSACINSASQVTWDTLQHIWLISAGNITNVNGGAGVQSNIGVFYGQYYVDLGSATANSNYANYPNNTKFGAINTGTGIPTGAYIDVAEGNNSVDVYGGDTFTQKSFMNLKINSTPGSSGQGGGVGVVFICQNRMNFNMRNSNNLGYPYPTAQSNWINNNTSEDDPTFNYDDGYTPRDPDCSLAAYDPAFPYPFYFPERIIYSLVQPQNIVTNNWDIYPPLNFYDLSSADGELTNITTLEKELVSVQKKLTARQFYSQVGNLNVDEPSGSSVVTLGSGAPFSTPGQPIISNRGNSNNLGMCKGVGVNGETVLAWIDIINQEFLVCSREGGVIKSLPAKMRSFFKNNLSLVQQDTPLPAPANPYLPSIVSVWDDKRCQFIFTVWGVSGSTYNSGTTYNFGDKVQYGVVGFSQQMPQVYISLANSNTGNTPSTTPNGTYWYAVPYSDQTSIADGSQNVSAVLFTLAFESPNFIVNETATDSNGNTGTVVSTNGTTNVVLSNVNIVGGGTFTGTLLGSKSGAVATITSGIPLGVSYNYWTIVYSIIPETNKKGEKVTGGHFTTFLSPKPYFYTEFKNTYLTSHPSLVNNNLWEDDIGSICSWYAAGLVVNGLITFPTNDFPEVSKGWMGQWYSGLTIPYYLNFTTPLCASYLAQNDPDWWNENNDNYYNSIKNDTITAPNGTNTEDSTFLYGAWLLTTVTFLANTAQRIFKIITKFVPLNRTPNN